MSSEHMHRVPNGHHEHAGRSGRNAVKDPVCGMSADPQNSISHVQGNDTYHFCSQRCRDKFANDPERYLKPVAAGVAQTKPPPGTIWTCPMHPEIRRDAPGPCPICGMALEPLLAAAVESSSEHPLGRAIVDGARAKGLDLPVVQNFDSDPGLGVWGEVGDENVLVGNLRLMQRHGVVVDQLTAAAEKERERGATAIYVAINAAAAGIVVVEDTIKATTPEAIRSLRREGVRVVMLTGDNEKTARAVGRMLELDEVIADVLPEDKANIVKRLQQEGAVVAMAGDGVNDAPALAQADVGIAMGTGTDVAMESAGVTLVNGDLQGIVRAVKLSHRTMRNIRQNLVFAFGYNAIGVPIAAGVLYPAFGLLLSPVIASVAMSLSSVSVVSNALRLRTTKL